MWACDIQPITKADFVQAKVFRSRSMNTLAGASVHSLEPKARVAEVYPYIVSTRFINHIIINKSYHTSPAHIVKYHNAKTGVTATL